MKVSAVIPHYYRAREPNLAEIVAALDAGSVRPCEVIVLANTPLSEPLPGASVMTPHRNLGAQGRFLAALTAIGDAVLFMDNDVLPQRETVANLLGHSRSGRIATLEGRIYDGRSYRETPKVRGRDVTSPTRVDLSLGRCEMVLRDDLGMILAAFAWGCVMDDMEFSAEAVSCRASIDVVPCVDGRSFIMNLPERGVGMSKCAEFYAERDRTMRRIMRER